jgi:hypothetical protein
MDIKELDHGSDNLQDELRGQGKYLNFHSITSEMLVTQYTFIEKMIKSLQPNEAWMAYDPLARAMAGRRTTRASDETLCLATILGLEVNEYQVIHGEDEEDTVQQRMIHFLGYLKRFSMGMVFNNYERLKVDGWRWAPRSLLDHRNANMGADIGGAESTVEEEHEFRIPDWTAHPIEEEFVFTSFRVQYPGFLLTMVPSLRHLERACAIEWEKPPTPYKYVVVELPPNSVHWGDWDDELAIMLETEPESIEKSYMCALGRVGWHRSSDDRTAYRFEHIAIGKAQLRDRLPPRVDVVKAPLLGKNEVYWHVH